MDIQLLLDGTVQIPVAQGFIGALIAGGAAIIGGLISSNSAKSTNKSNQQIAQQETETNLTSAREANALTEKLTGQAIKSTESQSASARALSQSQFEQSQAFNERMSNTAYTRGIKDLKAAGLNPILAATRGVTSTPSVSGGPTASGQGTGGSGTSARASQFRKIDSTLQGLNSAAAIGRAVQEAEALRLANVARLEFGSGTLAQKAETIARTSVTLKKKVKPIGKAAAGAAARLVPVYTKKLKKEKDALKKAAKRNDAARGPRSNWALFGPGRNR